jgi:hypothetical protein
MIYTVEVSIVGTVTVEVEASSHEDASELAIALIELDDVDFTFETTQVLEGCE